MPEAVVSTFFVYFLVTILFICIIAVIADIIEDMGGPFENDRIVPCVFIMLVIILYILMTIRWIDPIYRFFLQK